MAESTLAYVHHVAGDLDRALAVTRRVLAGLPVLPDPAMLRKAQVRAAAVLGRAGLAEEARSVLPEGDGSGTPTPSDGFELIAARGLVWWAQGRVDEARACLADLEGTADARGAIGAALLRSAFG